MGVCQSKEKIVNKEINTMIRRAKVDSNNTQKLLILGAGESGKSTVLKQMRLLHCQGFSAEELEKRKMIIYSNIIGSLAAIVTALNDLNITLENAALQTEGRLLVGLLEAGKETEPLTEDVIAAVKALWADGGIRRCYERRSEYQLNDCAKYFIEDVDRVGASDYTPNEQDMLYSRVPTTGVVQVTFTVRSVEFRVFDVGGQRSERKEKWVHCFDDVNAILYVMAISEYDQKLREDNQTNRLHEAISLFESVCNSSFFVESSMMVFLNKVDLFQEKLENGVPFAACFPNYRGGAEYEQAITFIKAELIELNRREEKRMYVHETCATDTSQVQKVVNSVIDMILQNRLTSAGMM